MFIVLLLVFTHVFYFSVSSSDDGKLRCPECKLEYTPDLVVTNPFINATIKPIEDDPGSSANKQPVCTSCDEDQTASSFCIECQEWLCDPCVIAHKRVKLTKDHTVSSRNETAEVKDMAAAVKPKQMFCHVHKSEALKLFCLTCEVLTCRDCQLIDHKDHKYQYVEETIESQKAVLLDGVKMLKTKLKEHEEMAEKIIEKEKDIKKQQVEVFTEVRKVADIVTNELITWCKQLLSFLSSVCHSHIKDLTFKKNEVNNFAAKAKHTIEFVESALQSGDDLSVLFTKGFMAKNIKQLQDQNINFQKTLLDLNIKYEHDALFINKNVSKMGFINVNGKSYPQHSSQNQEAEKAKQQSGAPPPQQQQQQPGNADPLAGINKDNFSQNIAELLNRQPVHVRDAYKNMSIQKKKQFLQTLMQQSRSCKMLLVLIYLSDCDKTRSFILFLDPTSTWAMWIKFLA